MGPSEIWMKISAWIAWRETNRMLPLSTHLFSHWSIPLNRGIFIDFFMYFFKYLPLSKLFAPRSKVSKICFSWIAVLFALLRRKKTQRYKDLLFLSFSFFKQAVLRVHTRVLYTFSFYKLVFFQCFGSTLKSRTSPGWIWMRSNCSRF